MNINVTQNATNCGVSVTQSDNNVKLNVILNLGGGSGGSIVEEDPIFKASEAYKFQKGDKTKLDQIIIDIKKKLDKPIDNKDYQYLLTIDEYNNTSRKKISDFGQDNKIESISLNNEVLEIDNNKNINIDITSKLDKISNITSDNQLYGKDKNGNQTMFNYAELGEKNIIEKITVNGVEQKPNNDKIVNIVIDISTKSKILKTVGVLTIHNGGNSYSVKIPASESNPLQWQNSSETIYTKTSTIDLNNIEDIDIFTHNRIDCIYLTESGAVEYLNGSKTRTGTPAPYPTPPPNTLNYSFVVFSNGAVNPENILSTEQVNNMIKSAKLKSIFISPTVNNNMVNFNLSEAQDNSCIVVDGLNVICTIPRGLGDKFTALTVKVRTGSFTLARQTGVNVYDYYLLTLNSNEISSLTKDVTNLDNYSFR